MEDKNSGDVDTFKVAGVAQADAVRFCQTLPESRLSHGTFYTICLAIYAVHLLFDQLRIFRLISCASVV